MCNVTINNWEKFYIDKFFFSHFCVFIFLFLLLFLFHFFFFYSSPIFCVSLHLNPYLCFTLTAFIRIVNRSTIFCWWFWVFIVESHAMLHHHHWREWLTVKSFSLPVLPLAILWRAPNLITPCIHIHTYIYEREILCIHG